VEHGIIAFVGSSIKTSILCNFFKFFERDMQTSDICAVIVTYHPDPDFVKRIGLVRPQVGEIIIVDNGSPSFSLCEASAIRNDTNLGIATALNQGVRWAKEHGFNWVLLLDQDTTCHPDMVERLAACANSFKGKLAVVGSHSGFRFQPRASDRQWNAVDSVITSGSLVPISAYDEIGPFRESFFIDMVDIEFCLRAARHGFSIIETGATVMEHPIGRTTYHNFLGTETGTQNHVAWRWYYQTRNTFILIREYILQCPSLAIGLALSRAKRHALMLLYESDRISKLKYSLRGFIHSLSYRDKPTQY
jgi:rhamnosyltransferase